MQTTCLTRTGCAPLRSQRATPRPLCDQPPRCSGEVRWGAALEGAAAWHLLSWHVSGMQACQRIAPCARTVPALCQHQITPGAPRVHACCSPYLKFGCLSPRLFHAKLQQARLGAHCSPAVCSAAGAYSIHPHSTARCQMAWLTLTTPCPALPCPPCPTSPCRCRSTLSARASTPSRQFPSGAPPAHCAPGMPLRCRQFMPPAPLPLTRTATASLQGPAAVARVLHPLWLCHPQL